MCVTGFYTTIITRTDKSATTINLFSELFMLIEIKIFKPCYVGILKRRFKIKASD